MNEASTPSNEEVRPLWWWLVFWPGLFLGGLLWWATGGFGDGMEPSHYPGSSMGCVTYKGSPYVFDKVVVWVALWSALGVIAWFLTALLAYRGRTRRLMLSVGLVLAVDGVLALWYANQLYTMRGVCS